MEMNFNRAGVLSTGSTLQAAMQETNTENAGKTVPIPILGGVPVTVTVPSDFEKLLAMAKSKVEKQNIELAKAKLSWALATITGLVNGLEESQNVAMVELEIATRQLEALVEAYTVTDEERAAKLETERRLKSEINDLEAKIASQEVPEEDKPALEAELAQKKQEMATVHGEIAQLDNTLKQLDGQMTVCIGAINQATSVLTDSSLAVLGTAVRLTAADVMNSYNEVKDKKKGEEAQRKQVWDVLNASFEKATADMRAEIEAKRTEMV